MKILLIGYGKMGKAIEKVAKDRGHIIAEIIQSHNLHLWENVNNETIDVAIEFTEPTQAFDNISKCLNLEIPVVSGTTGWLNEWDKIVNLCKQKHGSFFYASNFSVGMNLFFRINELTAELMNRHKIYQVEIHETHHIEKKDAPSGSSIALAERMLTKFDHKKNWAFEQLNEETIPIYSFREGTVPGTHKVIYRSNIDSIELCHTAFSRDGFANGAVMAAEWLVGKTGVYGMDDLLAM